MKNHKNVSDYAYNKIKQMILTLEFPPLSKLSESKVADILQTSKTPVREAFIRLSKEHLIEIQPQRGTFVTLIDISKIEEAIFTRKSVEIEVLRKIVDSHGDAAVAACRPILKEHACADEADHAKQLYYDSLFHKTIYSILGMERTWDMISIMSLDYYRIKYLLLLDLEINKVALTEHSQMIDYIEQKDLKNLVALTTLHLDRLQEKKDAIVERHKDYFLQEESAYEYFI